MRPVHALPWIALAAALLCGGASAAAAPAEKDFAGRLAVHHSDDFKRHRSVTRYALVRNGRRVALDPSAAPRIAAGTPVVVSGRARAGVIAGSVRPQAGQAHAAAAPLGTYRVAVLLVNFASDGRQPWSAPFVADSVFGSSNSAAAYYSEQSFGQVGVVGDVYGWYTIAGPADGCNPDLWSTQARAAALAARVNLTAYDSVAYAFPRQNGCGWSGLAELPGRQLWLNGDVSPRIVAHELGHNMGVHHAGALACRANGVAVAISGSCSLDEYGDPFDVMGSRMRRMGGWHLQQLGYLGMGSVKTVTADGDYTLRSTFAQTPDTQVLRIARTPQRSPREYYYVDLRASGGAFDDFAGGDPAVNGVTLRIGTDANVLRQSQLIDTTPGTPAGFADAPLAVGRTFSDGNVNVRLASLADGVATVRVSFGAPPPDIDAPSRPGDLSVTSDASGLNLAWGESSDDTRVAGYRVRRGGQVLATVQGLTYRDAAVVAGQSYSYSVEAFDAAGNTSAAASAPGLLPRPVAPEPPPAPVTQDTTAPALSFLTPGAGARLRGRTLVRASARDAGDVTKLELFVDGRRRASAPRAQLDWRWALRRVAAGRHKLALVARDASGNSARKTIAVRVVR